MSFSERYRLLQHRQDNNTLFEGFKTISHTTCRRTSIVFLLYLLWRFNIGSDKYWDVGGEFLRRMDTPK